ncbi:recombinase family protein [Cupriavidus sp. UGS-1]|uniref:recombinase family protein n=1 Tax=Cupriavidus sp. UGS-1 TaxID=2899826 RepID=UPI001E309BE2|nr:recombinase family protein [Cupriavidus sp. UGS-1]MCD9124009.1 recombinase family protein [Cupriavidus sp. UGS-1]
MRDPADRATRDIVSGGLRIGYARVSTADQNLDLQRDALTRAGCVQIYEEKLSGKSAAARPELVNVLRALREGDTLVVWRLDRLARSVSDLIRIVEELAKRGIGFESLNERIDTSSAQGRMFLSIMGAMAQFQREIIAENTAAGLKAARARGRMGGRPAKLDDRALREITALLRDPGITVASVAERYGVSRATLYNSIARAEKKAVAAKSQRTRRKAA